MSAWDFGLVPVCSLLSACSCWRSLRPNPHANSLPPPLHSADSLQRRKQVTLLIQVSKQFALFRRKVAVAAKVDFSLAGKRRHLTKRARGLQHCRADPTGRKFKPFAGVIGY